MNTDILDFDIDSLYFDTPLSESVEKMICDAGDKYGKPESELLLLRAYLMAPEHLTVQVALYRYYYYQCRLEDAVVVAGTAMKTAASMLQIRDDWRQLTMRELAAGAYRSIGLVRFYLLALKATGFVQLRLHNIDLGKEMLKKVVDLDPQDRLKTAALLELVEDYSDQSMEANEPVSAVG